MHPKTPIDWLRTACEASAGSHDPHTQNGAVIVPVSNQLAAVGCNKIPKGVVRTPDRLRRPEKYAYIEHAERAAIYAAARSGIPTVGATLYCPWFACTECARAIIMAGVTEVVGHVRPRAATPARWTDEIVKAEGMLTEAGVSLRWLADRLGVSILFDGEEMEL